MPHVRCKGCGVVSWMPARADGTACPECGVPQPRRPDAVLPQADRSRRLARIVGMTRELLGVELALLTEIADGDEHVRVVAGDWPEFGSLENTSTPLADTYCGAMLGGRIAQVVPDTRATEAVADLAATREYGVGAYLGVPIRPSDAELYVLCCLAREARPGLGTREVRLLSGLAESVRAELTAPLRGD